MGCPALPTVKASHSTSTGRGFQSTAYLSYIRQPYRHDKRSLQVCHPPSGPMSCERAPCGMSPNGTLVSGSLVENTKSESSKTPFSRWTLFSHRSGVITLMVSDPCFEGNKAFKIKIHGCPRYKNKLLKNLQPHDNCHVPRYLEDKFWIKSFTPNK